MKASKGLRAWAFSSLVWASLSLCVFPAKAATYYVSTTGSDSTGDGSAAHPWASISYPDTQNLLGPGDTVLVQPGTYLPASAAGIVLSHKAGGAGIPITYLAGGKVVLDLSGFSGASYGFQVRVPYIVISGFEVKGAAHGIVLDGSASLSGNNCVVTNCLVHDSAPLDSSGVYLNQCTGALVVRNVFYNINAGNDATWTPVGCGVCMSSGDNNTVVHNTMDNCYLGVFYYGTARGGSGYGHITTLNNIVVNSRGWAFVNPWSTDPSWFTSGYNLVFNDAIAYGNYPANNNAPTSTDIMADPKFINPSAHIFYLQPDSPAIGSGMDVGLSFTGIAPSIGAFGPLFTINQAPNQLLSASTPAVLSATVTGPQPFSVQWFRNGIALAGATNSSYTLAAPSLCDNGAVFSLAVSNSLGQGTNSGTTVTVIQPLSLAVTVPSNRVVQLSLSAQPRQWYRFEVSTNLSDWAPLAKSYNSNGLVHVNDAIASNAPQRFYRARLAAPEPAFSFTYNSFPSAQLQPTWNSNRTDVLLDSTRQQTTVVYNDPVSGLQVTCQSTEYNDFPAKEWVLYFQNNGGADTPILEAINALDMTFSRADCGEFTLYSADGCSAMPTDFQPHQTSLPPFFLRTFAPTGGRSSADTAFPYYNVAQPDGGGAILAVGWSGQWSASFARDGTKNLNVRAGMQLTHLVLHHGERIRTPAILSLAYQGDRLSGQTLFRKLVKQHYTPTPDGQPIVTPVGASPHSYIALGDTSESNMLRTITNIVYNDFPVNMYWIDAGWFHYDTIWEFGSGNWFPDPARYPRGMKPVADMAHNNGMKFLLWFEPERVMPNTALYNSHPEWLLNGDVTMGGRPCYLLNLGIPAALNWAKTNFSALITSMGIDIYRLDFNMPPLNYWRGHDAANRQGITEIFYIMGLYDFLDALQRDHASLFIDNSSAAGHRLDFEMARRSIPLNRSDYGLPVGAQCMEYALSFWLPYQGLGSDSDDPYVFRSGMGATAVYFFPQFGNPNDPAWGIGRQMINAYQTVKPYYFGDFYPLTPYSTNETDWLAYQFDRPDLNGGVVHAFARSAAGGSKLLKLVGLQPGAQYALTSFDAPGVTYASGSDLMTQGMRVRTATQPGAVVLAYQKVSP